MKSITAKLATLAAAFALAACSTVSVTTDYDRTASFAKYRTYTLSPAAKGQALSPSSEAALSATLRSELAARGLTEVSTGGKADLAVVRHVFTQDKVSVQRYTDWGYGYGGGWPYGYGYYGMWAGAPRTYTDVNQYTQGTMILDFVDTRTRKLVFRGQGTSLVGGPESNAAKIREGVRKIVADFPR